MIFGWGAPFSSFRRSFLAPILDLTLNPAQPGTQWKDSPHNGERVLAQMFPAVQSPLQIKSDPSTSTRAACSRLAPKLGVVKLSQILHVTKSMLCLNYDPVNGATTSLSMDVKFKAGPEWLQMTGRVLLYGDMVTMGLDLNGVWDKPYALPGVAASRVESRLDVSRSVPSDVHLRATIGLGRDCGHIFGKSRKSGHCLAGPAYFA